MCLGYRQLYSVPRHLWVCELSWNQNLQLKMGLWIYIFLEYALLWWGFGIDYYISMVFSITVLEIWFWISLLCANETAAIKSGEYICGDVSRDQTQHQCVHVSMYNVCSKLSCYNSLPSDVTLLLYQSCVSQRSTFLPRRIWSYCGDQELLGTELSKDIERSQMNIQAQDTHYSHFTQL